MTLAVLLNTTSTPLELLTRKNNQRGTGQLVPQKGQDILMGTRNITEVKLNNKTVIRQYGQWDGYPATAGSTLVDFLKEDDNLDWLKEILTKQVITYISDKDIEDWSEGPGLEYLVSYYPGIFGQIHKWHYDNYDKFQGKPIEIEWQAIVNQFGYHDASMYIATVRNTGYYIFNALKFMYSQKESVNFLPVYINYYQGWDIEAKYLIDLDNPEKLLTINWHSVSPVSFAKGKLPSLEVLTEIENTH